MKTITLPDIDQKSRNLVFDGIIDARYSFPVWSMMSRKSRVFFKDGDREETIFGAGTIEVLSAAADHRNNDKS